MSKTKEKNKEKNKYKSQKRRIFVLLLLVVFMIMTLSLSSYAWFSSNKHATIDSIDINVATVTGLQVSVDAIDWGNDVTKEALINAYKTYPNSENQLPDTFANVSTAGHATAGKLDMFYGLTTEDVNGFTLTTIKQDEKRCTGDEECENRHYAAFDIFLLVTNPATIAITGNSNVIPQADTPDKGAKNAARVGFVVEGTVDGNASYDAQRLSGGTEGLIWEPNYDVHTPDGVLAAKNVYGITTSTSGGARLPYKGVNAEFHTPVYIDQTDKSSYFTSVNPKVATTYGFTANQTLMNIPAGITKIRIYLWLEGQDVDMENNASSSKLTYNIELVMIN